MARTDSFWAWQNERLRPLLWWGAGSVVVGAGMRRGRSQSTRQIGLQALAWGAIDLALAVQGRRAARAHQRGERPVVDQRQAAVRFRRIVAVNAGLDVVYLLAALDLARTAPAHSRRHGAGQGIGIQGLFLLIYDLDLIRRCSAYCAR